MPATKGRLFLGEKMRKLDARITNCLEYVGISMPETQQMTDRALLRIPNLGHKCLARIRLRNSQGNPADRVQMLSEAPVG